MQIKSIKLGVLLASVLVGGLVSTQVINLNGQYVKGIDINGRIVELSKENNSTTPMSIPKVKTVLTQDQIKENTVVNHILSENSSVSREKAHMYAREIIKDCKLAKKEYGVEYTPYVHASLICSEGNWETNPNHPNKGDKGMTGINVPTWGKELKEVGIIKSPKDLENPLIAIKASSYVLSKYLKEYHGKTYNALVGYKGVHAAGRERARKVINLAYKIKATEKDFKKPSVS